MSPRLKNVKAGDFIRALERDGFIFKRQSGSHKIYVKPRTGRQVMVAYHSSGETLPKGILNDLIKDAGWTEDDLIRLKIMRKG